MYLEYNSLYIMYLHYVYALMTVYIQNYVTIYTFVVYSTYLHALPCNSQLILCQFWLITDVPYIYVYAMCMVSK